MNDEQELKIEQTGILQYPFEEAHTLECPAEYERLRQECPVARVQMPYGGEALLLTRYADVAQAFTHPACGMIQRSDGDVPRVEAGEVTGAENEGESLFTVSDARHNKVRRLVTRAFTAQAANALRGRVMEVTNELVDAMEHSGSTADLLEDYALQTPMAVLCELLGVPREEEKLFRESARSTISTTASPQKRQEQTMKLMQYLGAIITQERINPRENVLSLLIKAREQGDEVISEPELYSFAIGLIAAGFETVSTTFTNSAFIVLQRPDLITQLKELVDVPERMTTAIEEILRVTPISKSGRPRIIRDEVVLGGTTIPKGEVLFLSTVAANYDESVFPHASTIDFEREGANTILTFGRGIHACLGQQIARMELQVLWRTLLKRLPTIHLAAEPEQVPWRADTLAIGPTQLPVTW